MSRQDEYTNVKPSGARRVQEPPAAKSKKTMIIIAAVAAVLVVAIILLVLFFTRPQPDNSTTPVTSPSSSQSVSSTQEPTPSKPPETYPLTGLPLSDPSLAYARPISVKIENSYEARPQLGINAADVVYETLTEGGITRFNCIYQSTLVEEVGPVRSARNSDVTIVPQYDALLFFSGANPTVLSQIGEAGLADMSGEGSSYFHRVSYRSAPHNFYFSMQQAYEGAQARGYATNVSTLHTLEFGQSDNKSATAVTQFEVPFSDGYRAHWEFDSATGNYLRSMDGATVDAGDGSQVAVSNVVVLWAKYTPDNAGGTTFEVNMNAGGKCSVFTGGKRIDGTWESDGSNPPRFKDADGQAIKLTPGQTWFQVPSVGTDLNIVQ